MMPDFIANLTLLQKQGVHKSVLKSNNKWCMIEADHKPFCKRQIEQRGSIGTKAAGGRIYAEAIMKFLKETGLTANHNKINFAASKSNG
ncbi:MAG: hypothetical protein HKL88_05230 [Bacteroidia bacterium]|nr:hypothetical protein [Bacteroidia bacterium]